MARSTNPEAKRSPHACGLVAPFAERVSSEQVRDRAGLAGPYAGS